MLNPSYRYIGLDFETTGLDFEKDEPIQIGIVEIDHTGKIIKEFSSLLKPNRDLNELKTIVGFITGLNVEGLAAAPTPAEVEPQIQEFFGEKTVLIGHNIAFDEQFLQKFFPNCSYSHSIDTFPLAQVMIHYQGSYALEILMKNVKNGSQSDDVENFHDALFDTQNALKLFLFMIEKIQKLTEKYPILSYYTNQEWYVLSKFLAKTGREISVVPNITTIPKLTKNLPANTQAQSNEKTINTDELENGKRYYVWNTNLKGFLERCIGNKNIILAFSNNQKLDIAKNLLNDMWIKNIWFLKDDQVIDYDKFTHFLQKKSYTDGEVNFILKYYSHLDQWYGMLDLNTKSDYQIYHSLKNKKAQTKYPIVLATHQGLFYGMQEWENIYKDHEIFFMDAERRYKSYNMFLWRGLDLYYILNFIETIVYKKQLEAEYKDETLDENDLLKTFANSFQIFIGQIFMESKPYFVGTNAEQIQVDPLETNSNFYKSKILRDHIKELYVWLKDYCEEDDFAVIKKHMLNMDHIFNTLMTIQKKATNNDYYFIYNESTKYTSRSEFMDIFTSSVYFFSNSDQKAPAIFSDEKRVSAIPTIAIWLYERILNYINKQETNESFFIVSTRKEESKQIFDTLYKNNIHNDYLLLIENITWWMGKNIAKAKDTKKKIIIWWYAFLLAVYASKIPLDEIIIFNIKGNNEQSILDDIQRYAPK